jgi:Ca-activated chloride channel family protein
MPIRNIASVASNFHCRLKTDWRHRYCGCVQSALKARTEKTDRPFVIIFLTDGLPTVGTRNSDEIVAEVKKAGDARIFSFGIGSDVNTQLLDQIAEGTRAFSQYVLANEDLEVKVSSFYTGSKNRS